MEIYYGKELKIFTEQSLDRNFKERFLLADLHDYMTSDSRRVCCLYGLRRTGRTIMMLQEIKNLGDYENSLLISCNNNDDLHQLKQVLEEYLEDNPKCKYIFIDDITKAKGFIDSCSFLADDYTVTEIKIVLSGKDSLSFLVAEEKELFDRVHFIHTTYIPFKEYNYLFEKGILDYIRYGGTLTDGGQNIFYNNDGTDLYINNAIAENISNTIERWHGGRNYAHDVFRSLMTHYNLTSTIRKVIEYHNRIFVAEIINKDFKSHDLGSLFELMKKPKGELGDPDIIDTEEMNDRVRSFLGVKESLYDQIGESEVNLIIDYLKKMDVLYQVPKTVGLDTVKNKEYLFTQIGIRYCQAADLIDDLVASDRFMEYTQEQQDRILKKLESDINRQNLKDVIFYQIAKDFEHLGNPADKTYEVTKYRNNKGDEIDILIMDFDNKAILAIEVELSGEQADDQREDLVSEKICGDIEAKTGYKIVNKAVIYLGENGESDDGVLYINAEDFLKRSKEISQTLLSNPDIKEFKQLL